MMARNTRSDKYLAERTELADSVFSRMKGLLGRDALPEGDGVWLKPCNWVHTIGMRFPIDVVFVDENLVVVGVEERIPPNRFSARHRRARSALELPAGTVAVTETREGDALEIA